MAALTEMTKRTTGESGTDPDFVHFGLDNYAQTLDWTTAHNDLPLNPVNLVDGAITKGWKPIYMFNSYRDHPTAYHQLVGMVCLLQSYSSLHLGTDYQYLTIPGAQHSFHYWDSLDHLTPQHLVGGGCDRLPEGPSGSALIVRHRLKYDRG